MELSKEQLKFKKKYCLLIVLALAGTEVTFFIAALMVLLCFGFVAKIVLVTHTSALAFAEHCLHSIKVSFFPHSACSSN